MKRTAILLGLTAALAACGGGGDDDGVDGATDGASFDSRRAVDGADVDGPDVDGPLPLLDAVIGGPDAIIDGPDVPAPDAAIDAPGVAFCSTGLAITTDETGRQDLVISEIDPGAFIEVYNNSGAPIVLGTSTFQFCSPFSYAALSTLAPTTTIAPGGYAALPWPAAFTDTEAGGEVILYANGSFAASTSVVDFVCWGTNPHSSRKATAEAGGKWDGGACAGALASGASIKRLGSTTGTHAADYNTVGAPTPETCAPAP